MVLFEAGSLNTTFNFEIGDKSANEIYAEIVNLKKYIENVLPNVKVFLSCPVIRADNIRANHTLMGLDELLKSFHNVIDNNNIDENGLGRKGLHLNKRGSTRLAMNFISRMRRL